MEDFDPDRFETGRPMLLAGLRRRHAFEATHPELAEQWREFVAGGEVPGRVGPNRYGVMCGHDGTGFEYMTAVEVESFAGLPEGTGRMRVPAQRYAVFIHHGPGSTLRSTWERILGWLSGGRYESAHAPDFEVYRPGSDPLSGEGGIEIWAGVVPRSTAPGTTRRS